MPLKLAKHAFVSTLCGISLAFVLGGVTWAYAALHGISGPLVLHFSDNGGVTEVGGFWSLMGIGTLAFLAVGLNAAIALELDARNAFLGKFLASMALVLAVLLFIAGAAIISVN